MNNIVRQGGDTLNARDLQRTVKSSVIKEKRLESQAEATLLTASLQPGLRRSVLVTQEKGESVCMADSPPTVVPWPCTPQGGISRCPGAEIWVATPPHSAEVRVW